VIIECSSCSKKIEMKKRNTSKTLFSNPMDYNCRIRILKGLVCASFMRLCQAFPWLIDRFESGLLMFIFALPYNLLFV
jgi:hypothetical protein